MWTARNIGVVVVLALGCTDRAAVGGDRDSSEAPWSEAWLAREGRRFLDDTPARRAALERSLTNHDNLYSRQRLSSYALGNAGWDLLPVWNPRSVPVTAALAARLDKGELPEVPAAPLWDGERPATLDAWVALGRRVFFGFPMRAEVYVEHGLTQPALAAAVGLERTADGALPGLVLFANVDSETRVGITCASCHSAVKNGAVVAGAARRTFDYGRLRVAYPGIPLDPEQARRMSGWGPGRAEARSEGHPATVACARVEPLNA